MFTTVENFLEFCMTASNHEIYDAFEDMCTDAVRDEVYEYADVNANEPLRSAMHKLGFTNF